jgi:putative glutamine amidotransferase
MRGEKCVHTQMKNIANALSENVESKSDPLRVKIRLDAAAHCGAVAPVVLIVGRVSPEAKGVREAAFAAGQRYFLALERAGAVPLLLPPLPALLDRLPDLLDRVDGIVLHGGGDVDPTRYGQEHGDDLRAVNADHDEVELAVARAAVERDLPLLGICRGMQVLNVALGGTLVQHIDAPGHMKELHPVQLEPGSRLAKALGGELASNCHSVHHQALDAIAPGLTVIGRAEDGTIEAVESDANRWVVAVQWHPEDTAADDPQQQALFDELTRQSNPLATP